MIETSYKLIVETSPIEKFIVSSKGFLKSFDFKKETLTHDIVWVQNVKDASSFSGKKAKTIIEKLKLEAFIWSPKQEFHSEKGFWVRKVSSEGLDCWAPVRTWSTQMSDSKFLREESVEKVWSLKEATEQAIMRNQKLIEQLTETNAKLKREYINTLSKNYGL